RDLGRPLHAAGRAPSGRAGPGQGGERKTVGRRRRWRHVIYKLCSLLLQYPDEELLAAGDDFREAVDDLPRSSADAATALDRFLDWWLGCDPIEVCRHYVETLDLNKRSGLYMTFYSDGDKRQRGAALLRLKQMYRSA